MACIPKNLSYNLEKAKTLITEAKEHGAELIVLPELFNTGYDLNLLPMHKYDPVDTLNQLMELSEKLSVYIVGGIVELDNDKLYNSVFVINKLGKVEAKYRKINLFCLGKEKQIFSSGKDLVTFNMDSFKFGIMICYDIRFPEMAREYLNLNCSALLVSSAFPFPRLEHWKTLLKARAIENQIYIIASNRVGKDDDYVFLGNSCIIDPWGTVKAALNETDEGIAIHEINIDKIREIRSFMPCIEDMKTLKYVLK